MLYCSTPEQEVLLKAWNRVNRRVGVPVATEEDGAQEEERAMRLSEERITEPVEGSQPLKVFEAQELGMEVPDWTMHRDRLERTWEFPTFEAALNFVIDVAQLAAKADHHPDIHISYKTVSIELSTHKIRGLSRNDFIMAAQIDEMVMQPA